MQISVAQLPSLYAFMSAHNPPLEVVAIQCPDQTYAGPDAAEGQPGAIDGARTFALLANSNPSGVATVQVKVIPLTGPKQGQVSDFLNPEDVDSFAPPVVS